MGTFREKNGGLEYRFTYTDAFGRRQRKSVTGKSREDCLAKGDAFLRERKAATDVRDVPVPEILEQRIRDDFNKNLIGEATCDLYMEVLGIIRAGRLAEVPVSQLDRRQIEAFLRDCSGYSESMLQKIYAQIRKALREAKAAGVIESDPTDEVAFRRPRSAKGTRKVYAFTPDEQALFERVLGEYRVPRGRNNYKLQLLIELYSGLRMGEINALRPVDIDLEGGEIHVRATITRGVGDRVYRKENAKSERGNRSVPIGARLRALLEEALEQMGENPRGLVFYDHNKGDVISTQQVNNFFLRVLARAGIEPRGQHALRHTFATRCIESGVQASVLKVWLGHTDIRYTLDTYADVFDGLSRSSIQKLDNAGILREPLLQYGAT